MFSWNYRLEVITSITSTQLRRRLLSNPFFYGEIEMERYIETCRQCHGTNLVSVNVSPFYDIPDRETHCRDCGEVNWVNQAKKDVRMMTRFMMMRGFEEDPDRTWTIEEMDVYLDKHISTNGRTYKLKGMFKILVIQKRIVRVGTGLYQLVR